MLQVQIIDDRQGFAALGDAWNTLLDAADPRAVFKSHEWYRIWYEAFAPDADLHVLVVHDAQAVRGILPLIATVNSGAGRRRRQLQLLANGHSPCADLVCRGTDGAAVRDILARHLRQQALKWDIAVFAELAADAELVRMRMHYPESSTQLQAQRAAPFIPLRGSWNEYSGTISKRFLKVLRNNCNRVEKSHTPEIECLVQAAEVEAALEDAFAISERSWQGQNGSGLASTAANRRFYTDVTRHLGACGQLRLWFLKLDGRRVAFELHVVHAGVEFGLKTGFDPAHQDIGIGTYLDQHIVQQLFAEPGLHEYDLLGDADFYKRRWTNHSRDYVRMLLFGGSWQARILSLWHVRLLPFLKEQAWVRQLRAALVERQTVREGTT